MDRRAVALTVITSLVLAVMPATAQADEEPTAPAILGRAAVGQVLVVEPSNWEPGTVVDRQWFADGVAIAGADDESLVVTTAEREHTISVTESALVGESVESRPSSPTPKVMTTGSVKIAGTPSAGRLLRATPSGWTPGTSFAYSWRANGVTVAGATKSSFRPTPAQRDKKISVRVTGSKAEYDWDELTSNQTLLVQAAGTPTVRGSYVVGSTLVAKAGTWSPGTSFTYRWSAGGKIIKGATNPRLKLAATAGSKRISVRVTGRKAGYPTVAASSSTSAKVFTAAATPRIKGSHAVGRTLKAARGAWMKGSHVTYQWFADGKTIKGATKSSYRVTSGKTKKRITVRARGTKKGYEVVTRTSARTKRIQKVGKPSLSGSTKATNYLSVSPGTWASGTSYTYFWYLDGKKISGQSGRSIYLKPSWKGKRLSAKVRGTQKGFATFTVATKKSAKVTLPGRTDPVSLNDCPSWAPIKGNASSMIYHLPGQRFYGVTNPEDCFSTQSAARAAGYRKAKV